MGSICYLFNTALLFDLGNTTGKQLQEAWPTMPSFDIQYRSLDWITSGREMETNIDKSQFSKRVWYM